MDAFRWVKPVQVGSEPVKGHAIPVAGQQTVDGTPDSEPLMAQFYTAKCGRLVLLSADDQELTDDDALCEDCVAAVQDPALAAAVAEALPVMPATGGDVGSADTDLVVVLVRVLPTAGEWPYAVVGESTRVVHVTPVPLDRVPPARWRAYCGFLWNWDEVETLAPGPQAGAPCPDCFGLWALDREASRQAGGES